MHLCLLLLLKLNQTTSLRFVLRKSDGYSAVQVTTGSKKASRVTKPEAGHFAKAEVEAGRGLWEFRLEEGELSWDELTVEMFAAGQKIDVTGRSKGKGFPGCC